MLRRNSASLGPVFYWFSMSAAAAAFVLATISTGHAQLSPLQQEVMKTAQSPDGWLTEADHKLFWAPMASVVKNPAMASALRQEMDKMLGPALKFQLETWRSIQNSQRSGRVTKTSDYEQAKRAITSAGVAGLRDERSVDQAERMMVAAASKTAYQAANGPMYLNEETVEKVLSGLEGSFCRVRKLMDPIWSGKKTEYAYPGAHLKMITQCPLPVGREEWEAEGGVKVKGTSLTYVASESEYALVGFVPIKGRWADPNGALMRAIRSSFKQLNLAESRPLLEVWRGRKTATASGSLKTSQGTMNVTGRIIEGTTVQGMWSLMAVSTQSLADAHALLESVEKDLLLD